MTRGVYFTSSSGNQYFYDDSSGFIYPKDRLNVTLCENEYPQKINVSKEIVDDYLFIHGFKQLLLETTQSCNLRCKYCCYSEHYYSTRNHSNKRMDIVIAQKAVDYYLKNWLTVYYKNPMRHPVISFYGGEPLLNFQLIHGVIDYIKEKYPNIHPDYNMTTNGILLTEQVADFLVENNFSILFSLDGDKENHDRNRVKIDGTGSFDTVFHNLQSFRKRYPSYNKIGLSVSFDYDTDLQKVADFIRENDLFVVLSNMVSTLETDYYNKFSIESKNRFQKQLETMRKQYFNMAKNKGFLLSSENFLLSLFGFGYIEFSAHSILNQRRPIFIPYTGSCVPGEKIYVTVDGTFHACERINPNFPIGNVDSGLDIDKIIDYINRYNECTKGCVNCNITRLCDICIAKAIDGNNIKISSEDCHNKNEYVKNLLISYVDILENDPSQLDSIVTNYYEDLRKRIGNILD